VSPRKITSMVRRELVALRDDDTIRTAVARILEADAPALPVVDADGTLRGIFGEREFIGALFPAYLKTLDYAGFVPRSLEQVLDKRGDCAGEAVGEHMNTEHVDVGEDHSDTQVAEIFLHHRVLIVPIVDGGRVTGVITREAFFRALAGRLLGQGPG
jgi:CBS domain-containing protein